MTLTIEKTAETELQTAQPITTSPAPAAPVTAQPFNPSVVLQSLIPFAQSLWQSVTAGIKTPVQSLPSRFVPSLPFVAIALFGLLVVKLFLSVLAALNELPFFPFLFESIGLGYSVWFIYRHLVHSTDRQRLVDSLAHAKDQVMGTEVNVDTLNQRC